MSVSVSVIEQDIGYDPKLRDELEALGLFDAERDVCKSDEVAWALLRPSAMASELFDALVRNPSPAMIVQRGNDC